MNSEVLIHLIYFAGGLLQGFVGMGFGLLSSPLLILFLKPTFAIPLSMLIGTLLNTFMWIYYFKWIRIREIGKIALLVIIGLPIGVLLLGLPNIAAVKVILGISIVLSSLSLIFNLFSKSLKHKNSIIPLGIISGIMGASINSAGPALAIYYARSELDQKTLKANMITLYMLMTAVILPQYYLKGWITPDMLTLAPTFIPSTLLGMGLGIFLSKKTDPILFRKLVLIVIALCGLSLILSA